MKKYSPVPYLEHLCVYQSMDADKLQELFDFRECRLQHYGALIINNLRAGS
ncbi:MAG: hypothetical protein ABIN89_27315 [Chitinophagaceae bacterium]